MTTINSINTYVNQPAANPSKKEMGKEQFLKIMVAQLRNQDPTEPMQNGEIVAQMAQLSVLEQLSNLNQSLSTYLFSNHDNLSQYSTMLEKKVTWINPETNVQETGLVTGIKNKNNQVYFKIGDQEIESSAITSVEVDK